MKKSHYRSHFVTFEYLDEKTLEDFRSRRPLTEEEECIVELLQSTINPDDENGVIIPEEMSEAEVDVLKLAEIESISDTDEFRTARTNILKEANRMANYLRPGRKYPLLARNPVRVRAGRRFAYIGVDSEIHIGRRGKPLKVPMAKSDFAVTYPE